MSAATGKRKEEENSWVENKKDISFLIWVTELMKQSFSGEFCFLRKQKRESRNINAAVWILQFWRGWKTDRSLSQRWLLGHSLMIKNEALLPWVHLWPLLLSLKMLERKQQEGMSAPCDAAMLPGGLRVSEVHGGYARERGWKQVTVLTRWCCEHGLYHTLGTTQWKRKTGALKQLKNERRPLAEDI